MDLRTNPGRFIAVSSFATPSALAVLERDPRKLSPSQRRGVRWEHVSTLVALERFSPVSTVAEVAGRLRRVLASDDLAGDAAALIDVTEGGQAVADLVWAAGVTASAFRISADVAGTDIVRAIPAEALATELRLAIEADRLRIASGLTNAHGIRNELLRADMTSPTVRAIALAAYWTARTGHTPFASRKRPARGTPEHARLTEMEDAERDARELNEERRPAWKLGRH